MSLRTDSRPVWRRMWRKYYAVPPEHGSWLWWIGPLLIGCAAARHINSDFLVLALAVLMAFLLRQPLTLVIKALTGRRGRADLAPAGAWAILHSLILTAAAAFLAYAGHARVLWLGLPAVPMFAYYLWLVSRRDERHRKGMDFLAAGVLALAGPAAYWVCGGDAPHVPWIVWGAWLLQTFATIEHVHLRLAQRRRKQPLDRGAKWRQGRRPLCYHAAGLIVVCMLAGRAWLPGFALLAFAFITLEAVDGVARPPLGVKPTRIGFRQLATTSVFILLMMTAYIV